MLLGQPPQKLRTGPAAGGGVVQQPDRQIGLAGSQQNFRLQAAELVSGGTGSTGLREVLHGEGGVLGLQRGLRRGNLQAGQVRGELQLLGPLCLVRSRP
jgi:hypothetical protein